MTPYHFRFESHSVTLAPIAQPLEEKRAVYLTVWQMSEHEGELNQPTCVRMFLILAASAALSAAVELSLASCCDWCHWHHHIYVGIVLFVRLFGSPGIPIQEGAIRGQAQICPFCFPPCLVFVLFCWGGGGGGVIGCSKKLENIYVIYKCSIP